LAALSGEKTIAALSSEYHVHQTQIHRWIKQLKDSAAGIFAGEIKTEEATRAKELTTLHAKIGQLTVERDFLAEAWGKR
jgi:transposase